jgi:hypothetical protein
MGGSLPIAALRVGPVLSFANLLRIEGVFQHVLSNTTRYSRAVWMSLMPEERAIMLERYTIGVPNGGFNDPTQEVPLLNCVANEVLGYFGNSAVMPFFIPEQVAGELRITTRQIQEAIYKFHKQGFLPPRSSITLPSHGTLGEAVLGDCDSCEKIDLTRFWNWQDSPIPIAAPEIAAVQAGSRAQAEDLTPGQLSKPVLGIQAPTALPDAAGIAAIINAVQNGNMFRDMSGMAQTAALAQAAVQASAKGATAVGEQAGLQSGARDRLLRRFVEQLKIFRVLHRIARGVLRGEGRRFSRAAPQKNGADDNKENEGAFHADGVGVKWDSQRRL